MVRRMTKLDTAVAKRRIFRRNPVQCAVFSGLYPKMIVSQDHDCAPRRLITCLDSISAYWSRIWYDGMLH